MRSNLVSKQTWGRVPYDTLRNLQAKYEEQKQKADNLERILTKIIDTLPSGIKRVNTDDGYTYITPAAAMINGELLFEAYKMLSFYDNAELQEYLND